jgi:hypothetical protein
VNRFSKKKSTDKPKKSAISSDTASSPAVSVAYLNAGLSSIENHVKNVHLYNKTHALSWLQQCFQNHKQPLSF